MFKEIRQGLAESESGWRQIAQTRRLIHNLERDRRCAGRRHDQLDEMNRLDRERAKLSQQLLEATTTIEGGTRSAYVSPREIAAIRRQIEVIDERLGRLYTAPAPTDGVFDSIRADLRIELSVLGHQLLLILGIVIANIIFFGLLAVAFPYIFDWFFSLP